MIAILNIIACFAAAATLVLLSHRMDPHIGGTISTPWWVRLSAEALGATLAINAFGQMLDMSHAPLREVFVNLTVAILSVAVFAAMKSKGAALDRSPGNRQHA